MYRFLPLAILAATSLAAAAHADPIHISTSGKAPEQVRSEVQKAATQLCREEYAGSPLGYVVVSPCVRDTVRAALAQTNPSAHDQLAAR